MTIARGDIRLLFGLNAASRGGSSGVQSLVESLLRDANFIFATVTWVEKDDIVVGHVAVHQHTPAFAWLFTDIVFLKGTRKGPYRHPAFGELLTKQLFLQNKCAAVDPLTAELFKPIPLETMALLAAAVRYVSHYMIMLIQAFIRLNARCMTGFRVSKPSLPQSSRLTSGLQFTVSI